MSMIPGDEDGPHPIGIFILWVAAITAAATVTLNAIHWIGWI